MVKLRVNSMDLIKVTHWTVDKFDKLGFQQIQSQLIIIAPVEQANMCLMGFFLFSVFFRVCRVFREFNYVFLLYLRSFRVNLI